MEKLQENGTTLRVSEIISALSFALDLTEGQPMGHAVRSCVIAMRFAQHLGLTVEQQSDLYYATLMKDAGCSGNASLMHRILGTDELKGKRDAVMMDWTRTNFESLEYALSHVRVGWSFLDRVRGLFELAVNQRANAHQLNEIRCERGSAIARRIGLSENAALAIHSINEHWNGKGEPRGLRGEEIPLLSRVMLIAQIADAFFTAYGPTEALNVIDRRKGRWFDPKLARAFVQLGQRESFWSDVLHASQRVLEVEPLEHRWQATEDKLDDICLAFADVIDAKSPFTYRHSTGVAGATVAIARTLGMPEPEVRVLRRAALLHDVGKLGVPNSILDKPGKLTDDEWQVVKKHPQYTFDILRRIPGFENISEIAASHHEKLDGSGYFRGYTGERMSQPARVLVIADIYDALAARRPYRDALPAEQVFGIMLKDAPNKLDAECLSALQSSTNTAEAVTQDLMRLSAALQMEKQACEVQPSWQLQ